jgi:DNA invertase Pin-like site-specific DNA recombinase
MKHAKVGKSHLQRQAVIYVRQSTPRQVAQNLESQKRQYNLKQRAVELGWPAEQCLIIDNDQGISAAHSQNRPGYQRLISMLALREVGIVLGLEVARLTRNNLDWYQLLELAAAFDVLIADEDGVYDPSEFNDRLLLGLKGTLSEVELYQIRSRLWRGRLNKVKRGLYRFMLPVGMEWDEVTGKPRLAIDQSVRHAIAQVYDLFGQLHSARAVLTYLGQKELEIPRLHIRPGQGRQLVWQRPSYGAIYAFLTNPVYAGVYAYGKKEWQIDPTTQRKQLRSRPRDEWFTFIPDHHPGYITLVEYEENRRLLANNSTRYPESQGAPREGVALLQGLVYCGQCGRNILIRYNEGRAYYICNNDQVRFGASLCQQVNSARVDKLVVDRFLAVVNQGSLELSFAYEEKLSQEATVIDLRRQEKLQRYTYEAELAQRRYKMVDPANRLVAQTLETEWNTSLLRLEEARQEYAAQKPKATEQKLTLAQMRQMIANLASHWTHEKMRSQDRKALLRCLIESVFLRGKGKMVQIRVYWQGGAMSEMEVPKRLWSDPSIYCGIKELAITLTDKEIADHFNREGIRSVTGKLWQTSRVSHFRSLHQIPSTFSRNPTLRIPDSGYLTAAEVAAQLEVGGYAVRYWCQKGILTGKLTGSFWWIRWQDEYETQLKGDAPLDPNMIAVRLLAKRRGQTTKEIFAWARQVGYDIYRLRRGTVMKFYILLPEEVADLYRPK